MRDAAHRQRRWVSLGALGLVAVAAVAAILLAAGGGETPGLAPSAGGEATSRDAAATDGAASRPAKRSIVLVDRAWRCHRRVDLDLVKVTVRDRPINAIYLDEGCSGRVDRIEVDTSQLDGVKVRPGAHDLVIGGGYIRCHDRLGDTHQDGVQAGGGDHVTFEKLLIDCPTAANAAFFVSAIDKIPSEIVCDDCLLLPAVSTVNIKLSLRSGVRDSTVCRGRHAAIRIQEGARSPVNTGNVVLSRRNPRCS